MISRYQSGSIGRFISMDPMTQVPNLDFISNPQKLNSYSYVMNNPNKYIDPFGLDATLFYAKGDTPQETEKFHAEANMKAQQMIAEGYTDPIYVTEGMSVGQWNTVLSSDIFKDYSIDTIGYYGHGNPDELTLDKKAGVVIRAKDLIGIDKSKIAPRPTIYLYSCNSRVGSDSIAQAIADYFGGRVRGADGFVQHREGNAIHNDGWWATFKREYLNDKPVEPYVTDKLKGGNRKPDGWGWVYPRSAQP